jgi:hypothetical protein
MPANYVLLEKITVGAAGASSVTFSGIPQTGYTDLVLKCATRKSVVFVDSLVLSINGGGTAISANIYLDGTGSAARSGSISNYQAISEPSDYTANTFGNAEFYIPNYTSANYKSISVDSVVENNATASFATLTANLWPSTSSITSLAVSTPGGVFVQYSTFYLYGVAKLGTTPAIVPYATGGDEIMLVGSYWYHIFQSNGTFTPAKALSASVLSCGGGGGGSRGGGGGGGGGAGELDLFSTQSLASGTGYAVTIGAGGAIASGVGSNGGTTTFASLVSSLGGGKGAGALSAAGNGGSGGGGGNDLPTAGTASGSNTFAGGAGAGGPAFTGGGGGGATAVGVAGTTSVAGTGGQGYLLTTIDSNLTSGNFSSFTGMTRISSGGGGAIQSGGGGVQGGLGGTGGGQGGSENASPNNATASTSFGSGGGGSTGSGSYLPSAGYAGLVIVRYPV